MLKSYVFKTMAYSKIKPHNSVSQKIRLHKKIEQALINITF